jgi:glutathionylspermidine synthase
VVLGDVENLSATRAGASVCGRPIGALYRYFPFERMLGTPAFAAMYEAATSGRLLVLNGLFGLLLQHKGLLAWLWAHRDDPAFPPNERKAIGAHLPPTWHIGNQPSSAVRGQLVAKQVFGREGEEVFFGEDVDDATWATLAQHKTYVVQQRVAGPEVEGVMPSSGGPVTRRGHVVVGAFSVNGEWGGYYSRFGDKITTSRAKWVATLVDRNKMTLGGGKVERGRTGLGG